nr:myomegalin-like [Cherax quadricarinatus]
MSSKSLSFDDNKSFNYAEVLRRLSMSQEQLCHTTVAETIFAAQPDHHSGSPAQLQDANSLDSSGGSSIPFSLGLRSPGKVSPLRGRTMKEYEEQLGNLKKENFSLKLRIYFLEERIGQKYDKEDKDELYKTNIELKVETEALKQELYDKQELVRQASTVLSGLEQQFQEQVAQIKDQHEQEKEKLQSQVQQLQKVSDLTQSPLSETVSCSSHVFSFGGFSFFFGVTLPQWETTDLLKKKKKYSDLVISASPVFSSGIFSMPPMIAEPAALEKSQPQLTPVSGSYSKTSNEEPESAEQRVVILKARVAELEKRVTELEGELAAKVETTSILEGDIANLRKELEDKVEKIADLEVEVTEKDLKIDDVMQELETRNIEIQAKDDQIQSLYQDLNRVEPEIEVKVQEIVERDRIIEEKIEQIEQQNKILVEIQITLDEKQKQIADMEHKITESSEKIKKLTEKLDKSCKVIQTFAEEAQARDKEIVSLKKDIKRKEKKIRDLVAELKEALDMLNKAKWEAETSGGEDGVKEMAEEENERLWAELESRKNEVLALRAEHKHSLSEAEERVHHLQKQLEEKIKALESQQDKHNKETEEREARLRDQTQQVVQLESELQALRGDMSSREGQLRTNQGLVQGLEDELAVAKDQLKEKKAELEALQEELKKKNNDMQDLVNHELWERNREIERLQEKLSALTSDRRNQIECLKDELETKNNKLRRMKARLNCETTGNIDSNQAALCPKSNGSQSAVTPTTTDQPKNAAHLTVVTGSGGDVVTVNRPLHLTFTDDNSASVQMLYQEMSKVRGEAQALRLERGILNDKLSSLQKLYDQVCRTNNAPRTNEHIESHKEQLEESREENLVKDRKHVEIVSDFHSQVQVLRTELHNAKKKINRQLTEVSVRKYQEALKRHKQEIASLRKRLADSHNACDLLRTRLEELADFLERILEMEEKGLINLSQMSPKQLALLQKTLNESRALSRSLSQSLMIGMDFTDHGDDTHLSSSVSSVSSWSLQRDDSFSETLDYLGASSHEALASLPDETLLQPEDSHDSAVQALAAQFNTQIDQKAREIDAIAENVSELSEKLAERTQQVEIQAGIIGELRGQVSHLQDEIRCRDLQLLTLQADQTKDSQCALHSSWQSSINPLAASSQSTVHAVSPQTTLLTHNSSSQESIHKSLSNCSDSLPPPPLHLLQDSECEITPDIRELEICHASDRSSLSAVKSAYSTDAAIKAYSGHLGYFQQHVTPGKQNLDEGLKPLGEKPSVSVSCVIPEQPWVPVSPSESGAWTVVPNASDRASHESVTSIEFFHPLPENTSRKHRVSLVGFNVRRCHRWSRVHCNLISLSIQLNMFYLLIPLSTAVVPNASDRASHESVTSIEFFHPLPENTSRKHRAASLSPTSVNKGKVQERRALSSSRRRDGSKRISTHWSEDKENLHIATTTITTTTTNSSKRNRRIHSGNSSEAVFPQQAAQPLLSHQPEEEGDGGTTSGESPDLGIGSDYHFSSLERGTRTLHSLVHTAHDLPIPPLCSEPNLQQFLSHSTLSEENQQLRLQRDNLTSKLASTTETLKEALEKLSKANQRKENVERAICKQLYKTHDVLKKAKTHLKQANALPQ